jgi:serine/threonine-protein kinase
MMTTVELDEVSFQLKEAHSFEWLQQVGNVFAVFDQQDSGNISFGVQQQHTKLFVKYAGAKTVRYQGEVKDAIDRLQQAVSIYSQLKHPNLTQLIDHFPTELGYAAVYEWFDGENLYHHWKQVYVDGYAEASSPISRYRALPVEVRLASLDAIYNFHLYVAQVGYVAADFYDGSILYDFTSGITKICDIDMYRKAPIVNEMGRMWGSSRFLSPEEHTLGADIDEVTNVFNMGATAFCLLGGGLDRSFTAWEGSSALYEVALKAVEPSRENRWEYMQQFYDHWKNTAATIR